MMIRVYRYILLAAMAVALCPIDESLFAQDLRTWDVMLYTDNPEASFLVHRWMGDEAIIADFTDSCSWRLTDEQLLNVMHHGIRYTILRAPRKPDCVKNNSSVALIAPNSFVREIIAKVNSDSMVKTITDLQNLRTRYEYEPQDDSAASYILDRFQALGIQAYSDWFGLGRIDFIDLSLLSPNCWQALAWSNDLQSYGCFLIASLDGGISWTSSPSPVADPFFINYSANGRGWIVGYDVIAKSNDSGRSWVNQSAPWTQPHAVDFYNSKGMVSDGGALYITNNEGNSWTRSYFGAADIYGIKVVSDRIAYTVGQNGQVYKTDDFGGVWSQRAMNPFNILYCIDFYNTSVGMIGGICMDMASNGIILKTVDGGATWSTSYIGTSAILSVCWLDSIHWLITNRDGRIYQTDNSGQDWYEAYDQLTSRWDSPLYKIKACGPVATTVGDDGLILVRKNIGDTWKCFTSNLPPKHLHRTRNIVGKIPGTHDPSSECLLVAHYDSRSNDNINAPGADDNASGVSAILETARLCRTYLFEKTLTFAAVAAEELGMRGSRKMAVDCRESNTMLLGVINADMIGYPSNIDSSWVTVGSYLVHNGIIDTAIACNNTYNIGIDLYSYVDSSGASDYSPFAKTGYDAVHISEGTAQEIWGGSNPHYHTTTDLVQYLNHHLLGDGCELMTATAAQLAKPYHTHPNVFEENNLLILHNYPNPFAASTSILYKIPTSSYIAVKIYNITGQEIQTLTDRYLESGIHAVVWKARGLANGIYFCRITSGGRSVVTKLTHIE